MSAPAAVAAAEAGRQGGRRRGGRREGSSSLARMEWWRRTRRSYGRSGPCARCRPWRRPTSPPRQRLLLRHQRPHHKLYELWSARRRASRRQTCRFPCTCWGLAISATVTSTTCSRRRQRRSDPRGPRALHLRADGGVRRQHLGGARARPHEGERDRIQQRFCVGGRHARSQSTFDPKGILNPYKVLPNNEEKEEEKEEEEEAEREFTRSTPTAGVVGSGGARGIRKGGVVHFAAHPHPSPSSEIPKTPRTRKRRARQPPGPVGREQWCVSLSGQRQHGKAPQAWPQAQALYMCPTALGDEPEARGEPRAKNQKNPTGLPSQVIQMSTSRAR